MGRKKRKGRTKAWAISRPSTLEPILEPIVRDSKLSEGQREALKHALKPSWDSFPRDVGRNVDDRYRLLSTWSFGSNRTSGFRRFERQENIPIKVFHGTPKENVSRILLQSLRIPMSKWRSGMFGKGIYLTPNMGKAIAYTGHDNFCFVFAGVVLLGKKLLMESSNTNLTFEELLVQGYDSVEGRSGLTAAWGGTLNYTEYVVFDPDRVLLTHLLVYGKVKRSRVIR